MSGVPRRPARYLGAMRTHLRAPLLASMATSFALLAGAACSTTSNAEGADASTDATAKPASCVGSATLDTTFDVDPEGPDGQVHAYVEPTEDGFFVVYNRPSPSGKKGNFAVYVARFGCDGKPVFAPTAVSDGMDNEIDPSCVWDGSRLVVVWSADTGKSPSNLELRTRVVGGDGKALGAITTLGLSRQGKPNTGNAWMPNVARGSSGVWLTGAWGVEGAPAFQVLAQALDEKGATKGEAIDVAFNAKVTQSQPVVAVDAAGKRWVAWAEEPNEGQSVASAWVRGESGEAREVVPGGGNPSIASGPSGTWVAAKGAAVDLGTGKTVALPASLSQPAIAADDDGALVVGYGGATARAALRAVRIGRDGAAQGERDLGASQAAAYPLRLATVGRGLFVLAYQEGAGAAIRAKARFVSAEP
jgi:hypothetical protein